VDAGEANVRDIREAALDTMPAAYEMTDKNTLLATASDADAAATDVSNTGDYGTTAGGHHETSLDDKRKAIPCPACRHVLLWMMFLGFIAAFSLRGCFNEALVAMVNQTAVNEDALTQNISIVVECPRDKNLDETAGEFNWNRLQQGALLAAFYYGYIVTQVSASVLQHTYNIT